MGTTSSITSLASAAPAPAAGSSASGGTGGEFARLLGGETTSTAAEPAPALPGGTAEAVSPLEPPAAEDALAMLVWLPWMALPQGMAPASSPAGAANSLPTLPGMPLLSAGLPADPVTGLLAEPALLPGMPDDPALAGPALQPAFASLLPSAAATTTASTAEVAASLQATNAAAATIAGPAAAAMLLEIGSTSEAANGTEIMLDTRGATTPSAARVESPARATFDLSLAPGSGDDALADGVEARMQWMAERGIGRAQIRLSPAELGVIDIQLQMDGKQVRAEFTSANPEVRQALESQLPRLREMFLAQGMTLAQADVGHRQESSAGHRGNGDGTPAHEPSVDDGDDDRIVRSTSLRLPTGLLDEYA